MNGQLFADLSAIAFCNYCSLLRNYLLLLEVIFQRLIMKCHSFCLSIRICALQKKFYGAKLRLSTRKTEFLSVERKNLLVCAIQLPMNSKFLDNLMFMTLAWEDTVFSSKLDRSNQGVSISCKVYLTRDSIQLVRVLIVTKLDYHNSLL